MKTPLLLTLLLAIPLAHADDDTAQCDRAADPLHPGNPSGVRGAAQPPRFDDDNTAWDTLRLACENSYAAHPDTPRYAYQLARLYQARDYNVSAEKYLKTAAEQGDPLAQNAYGNTLNDQGYDGSEWLEKAAAQGFVPAMEALGDHYHDEENSDPDQARDWYQKAAAGGELHAALRLGDHYRDSDPAKARTYYQAATALGEAEAHYKLAELLRQSEPKTAREHYRKAALTNYDSTKSDAKAATVLGDIYRHGENVPQNLTEAYSWYSMAGSIPANMALAAMFENGEGVEADRERARLLYQRVSENYDYQIEPNPQDTPAVALAYQKHADLADADTPAEERKADYRQSLRLGNDAAIEKLRALGEPPYDINQILNERRQLRGD